MTCPRAARFGRMSTASWVCVFCKRSRSRQPQRREALSSTGREWRAVDAERTSSEGQAHRSVTRLNKTVDSAPDCEFMHHPSAERFQYANPRFSAGSSSIKTPFGPNFDWSCICSQHRSVFPMAACGIRFEGVLFDRFAVVSGPGSTTKPPRAGARGVSRRN